MPAYTYFFCVVYTTYGHSHFKDKSEAIIKTVSTVVFLFVCFLTSYPGHFSCHEVDLMVGFSTDAFYYLAIIISLSIPLFLDVNCFHL